MKNTLAITKLLSADFIEKNALPSNIIYGTAIYKQGAVEIIESTDASIEAWVGGLDGKVVEGGGSKRRVTFWRWHY